MSFPDRTPPSASGLTDRRVAGSLYRAGAESQAYAALQDILRSFGVWRMAGVLAWNDIVMRYRRSLIGPFWITIQSSVWAFAIALVYGALFGQDMKSFLPHVAVGIILWTLLGNLIQDGTVAFSHSAPYMLQAQMPKAIFVARVVVRQAIIFLHNVPVIVFILLWAGVPIGMHMLPALLGLALFLLAGTGVGLLVATIGARFRDLTQATQNILQVMFFLTPVMWKEEMLPAWLRFYIVDLNPLAVMLDIVRGPLLAETVPDIHWITAVTASVASLVAGFAVFARFRRRIPYWL